MELPYNEHVWFSPRHALNYLWDLMKKSGTDTILKNSMYKKEREAWIMGVALFGVMKLLGAKWWLQVPNVDPPDMRAMTLVPNHVMQYNEMHHREIEIMQITKYTDDTIVNEILRKLKYKSYVPKTGLVVYLNRKTFIQNMHELSEELGKAQPNISDVWVIAGVSAEKQEYVLFSLFPTVQVTKYDLDEEMEKLEEGDSIDTTPGEKTMEITLVRGVQRTKFIP